MPRGVTRTEGASREFLVEVSYECWASAGLLRKPSTQAQMAFFLFTFLECQSARLFRDSHTFQSVIHSLICCGVPICSIGLSQITRLIVESTELSCQRRICY